MMKPVKIVVLVAVAFFILLSECRNDPLLSFRHKTKEFSDSVMNMEDADSLSVQSVKNAKPVKIYGDTVRVQTYLSTVWYDTVSQENYEVYMSVWVDTTDYIVDTVISSKGRRIVIGYNHRYNLEFRKNGKFWFAAVFNKKDDLKDLLSGTDFWLESNIDVFQKIYYNKKFDKFIVDYNINPRYNYGTVYYFVFNTNGVIEYTGKAGIWGGGAPDGEPFITGNEKLFVTAYELYNFSDGTVIDVSGFSFLPGSDGLSGVHSQLIDLHGYRPLTDSAFLMIFNCEDNPPDYNAYILNTDTTVLKRFRYFGMIEEMDAILLFRYNEKLKTYYLYDTERKTLICISKNGDCCLKEISTRNMIEIQSDTLHDKNNLKEVSFEAFGTYKFFIGDSLVYYEIETF